MFSEPPREKSFPTAAVAIAAVAVVILVAVLMMIGHRKKSGALDASYAPNLTISDVKMSQSEQMTDGRHTLGHITYIEGHIQNTGPMTVTGATVKVTFANDGGAPPEVDMRPLRIIRFRTPEIDTAPLSELPLAPGKSGDFQLIFENVTDNWNQQTPAVQVVGVELK